LDTIHERDRRTDTARRIGRAMHSVARENDGNSTCVMAL